MFSIWAIMRLLIPFRVVMSFNDFGILLFVMFLAYFFLPFAH